MTIVRLLLSDGCTDADRGRDRATQQTHMREQRIQFCGIVQIGIVHIVSRIRMRGHTTPNGRECNGGETVGGGRASGRQHRYCDRARRAARLGWQCISDGYGRADPCERSGASSSKHDGRDGSDGQ